MNAKEFNNLQNERMMELLKQDPKTEWERYIWNLHYIEYSIKYMSPMYRRGCIRTIRDVIKMLEDSENDGKTYYFHSNPTIEDVVASMNDEQRRVLHYLVGKAAMGHD